MIVAARQQELRIHPLPDDLVAYHAQALAPEQSDQIQDHLSFCRDCSLVVMQLAPEIGAGRQYSPIPDQHVSEAWDRFVERLSSPSDPAVESESPTGSARSSSLAALAALLIAAVGVASFSIWIWRSLPQPQANASLVYLQPLESRERSPEREAARFRPDADALVLVLQPATVLDPSSRFGVAIESDQAGGSRSPVWRRDNLHPDPGGEFIVVLHRDSMPPGKYRLRLFELQGDQEMPLATYRLPIHRSSAQKAP